jgi:hypothetical protein
MYRFIFGEILSGTNGYLAHDLRYSIWGSVKVR